MDELRPTARGPHQPPRRRRWPRFRTRSYLIFIAILCIPLATWFNSARRQRDAVAAIEKLGGAAFYNNDPFHHREVARSPIPGALLNTLGFDFFHTVVAIKIGRSCTPEQAALILAGLPHLKSIHIEYLDPSADRMVETIARIRPDLAGLTIMWSANLTDDGLAHIANIRRLKYLDVSAREITDRSLETISRIGSLEMLRLCKGRFTDDGLFRLKDLRRLRHLAIEPRAEGATDAWMYPLLDLPDLQSITINEIPIEDWIIKQLKRLRPGLRITDESKITIINDPF